MFTRGFQLAPPQHPFFPLAPNVAVYEPQLSPNQRRHMSPTRKRPQCHTCNTPMAGHKRPNGQLLCPGTDAYMAAPELASRAHSPRSSRSRSVTPIPPPKNPPPTQFPTRGRWINPNYVEDPNLPQPQPGEVDVAESEEPEFRDTPETWVSTELNDDAPPVKHEPNSITPRNSPDAIDALVHHSIASSSSSPLTRLRSTFSWLGESTALATVFSTTRHQVPNLMDKARDFGLHAAMAHVPHEPVKRETSSVGRQQSWRVFLGKDAGVVMHLATLHEKEALGALHFGQRNERVGAYPEAVTPPPVLSIPIGTFLLFGLFCSGLTVLFVMWALSSY